MSGITPLNVDRPPMVTSGPHFLLAVLWPALCLGGLVATFAPSAPLALGLLFALTGAAASVIGHFLLGALRLPASPQMAFVTGVLGFAFVVAPPVIGFEIPILWPAGLFWLAAALLLTRWRGLHHGSFTATDLILFGAAFAVSCAWSHDIPGRFAAMSETLPFRFWDDIFIHSALVAEFGDVRAIGRGMTTLADMRAPLYHFDSYAIPGLAVSTTGLTPLAAAVTVWIPVGGFLTALGIVVLGRALSGVAGGALALLLFAIMPDCASYGLRNGFLSLHWMLETSPTSLYALPSVLVALSIAAISRQRDLWLKASLSSGLLLALTFLLRVHVLAWAVYPWAVVVTATAPFAGRKTKAFVILLGLLSGAAILAMAGRSEIHTQGWNHYLVKYLDALPVMSPATPYARVDSWLVRTWGENWTIPLRLFLVICCFGLLPLTVCAAGGLAALFRKLPANPIDLALPASLIWAVPLMMLGPGPFWGDFTEFRQRGFVLPVVLMLVWTARWSLSALPAMNRPRLLACGALMAAAVTWTMADTWKTPRFPWSERYYNHTLPPDLLAGARWLRQEAGPGTAFAFFPPDLKETLTDDGTRFAALSGVPCWLARPSFLRGYGGAMETAVAGRLEILDRLPAIPARGEALASLRQVHVDFLVIRAGQPPAWDPGFQHADFREGPTAIYRIPPAATP